MNHFTRNLNLTPLEEKKLYITNVLKKRFSSDMLGNVEDFINDVCIKLKESRGVNYEMLFIAYMCYSSLGLKQDVDKTFGDEHFVSTIIEWMKTKKEIITWYSLFKKKDDYTIDHHYSVLAFYIIRIVKTIGSDNINYDIPEKNDSSDDSASDEELEFRNSNTFL